ncbi:MAG: hypothetical protein ACKO5K_08355 [Armatimonadota bacterium]
MFLQGSTTPARASVPWFGIRFVDPSTGEGIPLVEVESLDRVVRVSDNLGWVAIEPGAQELWLHVRAHGYRIPADGFGFRGMRVLPTAGVVRTAFLERTQVAQRIARLTGAHRTRDSERLGRSVAASTDPFDGIVGMDSAQTATLKGRRWWFWGDTTVSEYPLGNFRTTGAEARMPIGAPTASNLPEHRVLRDGNRRPAAMVPGSQPGMVWISGAVEVGSGESAQLLAYYSRMKDLGTRLEHGHVVWDPGAERFRFAARLGDLADWRHLEGHPIRIQDARPWIAGGFTFPNVRVPNAPSAVLGTGPWEAFTCLDSRGSVVRKDGRPHYHWVRDVAPLEPRAERDLVRRGVLDLRDAHFLPRSPMGETVLPHGGSVVWNAWRKRWISVFTRMTAKPSPLGEIWYAEAKQPTGPWRRAVLVANFDGYTFYNPVLHPFFDIQGGRIVHFEGTYTEQFSDHPRPTPGYDYNQILHRLDLADPRLAHARKER